MENRSFLIHGDIHTNGHVLDDEILADGDVRDAIAKRCLEQVDNQGIATKSYIVVNADRSIGARISGDIAPKYGDSAFKGQRQAAISNSDILVFNSDDVTNGL